MGMVKSHFYEVAGLQLELRSHPAVDIDALLPSFAGFRKTSADSEISVAVVTLTEGEIREDSEMGMLRSDISLVWCDNFRLYERDITFANQIKHHVKKIEWFIDR